MYYNRRMPRGEGITPNLSIRIRREVRDQARIHAVANKKTLGQWLEEAILAQIRREAWRKGSKNKVTPVKRFVRNKIR